MREAARGRHERDRKQEEGRLGGEARVNGPQLMAMQSSARVMLKEMREMSLTAES